MTWLWDAVLVYLALGCFWWALVVWRNRSAEECLPSWGFLAFGWLVSVVAWLPVEVGIWLRWFDCPDLDIEE